MKTNLIISIFIAAFISSCSDKSTHSTFCFNPDQNTVIKFDFKNCKAQHSYTLVYFQTLPFNQTLEPFEINSDSLLYYNIQLSHPLYMTLVENKSGTEFFVIANDTLTIEIDFQKDSPLEKGIRFKGKTGDISDYLSYDHKHLYLLPTENQSPELYNLILDSISNLQLIVVDSLYQNGVLPSWFVDIQKENIQNERDYLKFLQYYQRVWMYNQYLPKTKTLFESIDLENKKYYWLESSINLLCCFRPEKYDTLFQKKYAEKELFIEKTQDNIDFVKARVSMPDLSYFVASRISMLFARNTLLKLSPVEFKQYSIQVDSFISENSHLINDSTQLNIIINEKNRKYSEYNNQNRLKEKTTAPGFYLADINGNFKKLSDYRGKLVLLNFWGTYCAPCIKSIQKKNELFEKYKDSNFELVNICMDANPAGWKKIIDENDFKGTHLICKGNWSDKLRTFYNVYNIPHFTLIDENGEIITNGLIDSIEYYIDKNIALN